MRFEGSLHTTALYSHNGTGGFVCVCGCGGGRGRHPRQVVEAPGGAVPVLAVQNKRATDNIAGSEGMLLQE